MAEKTNRLSSSSPSDAAFVFILVMAGFDTVVLGVGRVQVTEALAVLIERDFQGMLRPIQSGLFPYLRSRIPSRIPSACGSRIMREVEKGEDL